LQSRVGAVDIGEAEPLPERKVQPKEPEPPSVTVDLDEAMRNKWLELWYQPKIDLKAMQCCGAEALVRARHPKLGVIEPAGLLPASGDPLYRPLSTFVIRQALSDWGRLADQGLPLKLAVNMPASVLNAPDFIPVVRQLIPEDQRFPGLIMEVTEDEIIRDPEWAHELATQLKLYNVWLSIDDFGSGYASLSRLNELPFVEVKLDRSFVQDCAGNRLKQGLCQTVIDLAHRFGASVCAEGVETAEDLRALTGMGCDIAQGFLFAAPMPRDQFASTLLTRAEGMARAAQQRQEDEPARSASA
jgi:EAL domain-containing protein (putative c-di-GMP-specific phosphodiesterase class I)